MEHTRGLAKLKIENLNPVETRSLHGECLEQIDTNLSSPLPSAEV